MYRGRRCLNKRRERSMESWDSTAPQQRLPVSLLTGFLGSGKTTVLNHLVQQPELAKTIVIINEFGEIGLDHELVEQSSEGLLLLQSGCLCCSIRGDLIDTITTAKAPVAPEIMPGRPPITAVTRPTMKAA